jgi:hypothetical protein
MGENKRAWTAHGEPMTEADKAVIQGLVDKNRAAARIFVTGEAAESYVGEEAVRLLVNINEVFYENGAGKEPLFVQTREDTVRMTRFDPSFVWRCFHPDILTELVAEEAERLGVEMDPWAMDHFDFYESMIDGLKKKLGDTAAFMRESGTTAGFYQSVYLSCLLLFGKPGYMDVPVAEHFAQPEAAEYLRNAEVYRLNEDAKEKLAGLRKEYGGVGALTNQELNFVVDLYERMMEEER